MKPLLQPWQLLLLILAGWINRHQQEVIEYLRTENQKDSRNKLPIQESRLLCIPLAASPSTSDLEVLCQLRVGTFRKSRSRRHCNLKSLKMDADLLHTYSGFGDACPGTRANGNASGNGSTVKLGKKRPRHPLLCTLLPRQGVNQRVNDRILCR